MLRGVENEERGFLSVCYVAYAWFMLAYESKKKDTLQFFLYIVR